MTTDTPQRTDSPSTRKLTLADIADLRAYENEREGFREQIIQLKKRRRVAVGAHITFLFENRETMRFQIQEMARVEKIISDEGIENELRAYNPLIPEPGALSATLFIELTSEPALRIWLPKLLGIETSVLLRLHDGSEVRCLAEESHASQLTRDEITAAVHYIRFEFTPEQVVAFPEGPATLVIDHPDYEESTTLSAETMAELALDLGA